MRGLQFLRDAGFIHADIKPGNIGLINSYLEEAILEPPLSWANSKQRRLKAILLDVDSAKPLAQGALLPATPGNGGTLGFLSPERELIGYGDAEDLWALGVTVCRVLLGTRPFHDSRGNPWRDDAPDKEERRSVFHEQYEIVLDRIRNHASATSKFDLTHLRRTKN